MTQEPLSFFGAGSQVGVRPSEDMSFRQEVAHDDPAQASSAMRVLLVQGGIEPGLSSALAREGHDVLVVDEEDGPVRFLRVFAADVIVLAVPAGAQICRELRRAAPRAGIVAIVVGGVEDRIAMLDAGADDCVTTPLSVEELNARIRATGRLRPVQLQGGPPPVRAQ